MPDLNDIYQGIVDQITSDSWFNDLIWDPYYDNYWSETGYSDSNSLWSAVGGMFSNMLGSEFEALDSIANLQINNANDAFSLYVDNHARNADLSYRMQNQNLDHLKENTAQRQLFQDDNLRRQTNTIVQDGIVKVEGASALIGKQGLAGSEISQVQNIILDDVVSQVENARTTRQFARAEDRRKISKAELGTDHATQMASAQWDAQYGTHLQSHRNEKETIAFDLVLDKLNLYDQWAAEQVMSANRLMDSGFGLDYACPEGWYMAEDGVCKDGGLVVEGEGSEDYVAGCMDETDKFYNPSATVHDAAACFSTLINVTDFDEPPTTNLDDPTVGLGCGATKIWCEMTASCTSWEDCNSITDWLNGGNGVNDGFAWSGTCVCNEESLTGAGQAFGTDENGNWCTCDLSSNAIPEGFWNDTNSWLEWAVWFQDFVDPESTGEFLQDLCTGAAVYTQNPYIIAGCLIANVLDNIIPFWDTLGDAVDALYCGTFGNWFGDSGCDHVPVHYVDGGPYDGMAVEEAVWDATCNNESSDLYNPDNWICADWWDSTYGNDQPGGYHLDCTDLGGGYYCDNGNCIDADESCADYPCPPGFSEMGDGSGNCLPYNWQEILVESGLWHCGDGNPCPLDSMTCVDGICYNESDSPDDGNCVTNEDCGEGMICISGGCYNEGPIVCDHTFDCPTGWTCGAHNECYNNYGMDSQCVTNEDCSQYSTDECTSTCADNGWCTACGDYPNPFD